MTKSPITTHVLDTALGKPAAGMRVVLEFLEHAGWQMLAQGETNADGRIMDLLPANEPVAAGTYRMTFETGPYLLEHGSASFYPSVTIAFDLNAPREHYHIPLLLSPYGYSTYRGS